MLILRKNYEVQVNTANSLREEIRIKEEQFRQRLNVLETELKKFMESSRGASQEEVHRVQA